MHPLTSMQRCTIMLHFSTLLNLLPAHLYGKNSNSWEFVPFLKNNVKNEVSCISSILFMLRMRKVIKTLKNLSVDIHLHLKQKISVIHRIFSLMIHFAHSCFLFCMDPRLINCFQLHGKIPVLDTIYRIEYILLCFWHRAELYLISCLILMNSSLILPYFIFRTVK